MTYCTSVSLAPDPTDPERTLREIQAVRDSERQIDERLDPYSARFFPKESRTEALADTLRLEMGIEKIVRSRTWDLVNGRCGDSGETWEEALSKWRKIKEDKTR
jgi:Caffeine-induced death protein 2